jgi:hypothetical protein
MIIALAVQYALIIAHRASDFDMGLIVEIDSSCNTPVFSSVAPSREDLLGELLQHFYPPQELDSHKFISLIKYRDAEEESEHLNDQHVWEQNPVNWLNHPRALEKFETFLDELIVVDKQYMGALMPMALKVADCHKSHLRKKGLMIVLRLFELGDVQYFTRCNIIHIFTDSILISLTNTDDELVEACYRAVCELLTKYVLEKPDYLNICDAVVERVLFTLVHSQTTDIRCLHWTGLKDVAKLMGVAFVRHFHYFFKTCNLLSHSINTVVEFDLVLAIFALLETLSKERIELRQAQINTIKQTILAQLTIFEKNDNGSRS